MKPVKVNHSVVKFLPSRFYNIMNRRVVIEIFGNTVRISLKELIEIKQRFEGFLFEEEEAAASGNYPAITFVNFCSEQPTYFSRQKPGRPYIIHSEKQLEHPLVLVFLDATTSDEQSVVTNLHIFTKSELFFEDLEIAILLSLQNLLATSVEKKYLIDDRGIMDITSEE